MGDVAYNQTVINQRLQVVINNIDAGAGNGSLVLLANSTPISTISLTKPCATINGGVLTFSGTLVDPSALGTGFITTGIAKDSNGVVVLSGLTAGTPVSAADIVIVNGLNSTFISIGQTVQILSAQITGS
jgi:hypothetical protein